jgi:undecaprenyl-diphosphatase
LDLNGAIFDSINDLAGHVAILDRLMEWAAQYAVFAIFAIVVASWFIRAGTGADRRMAVYTAAAAAVAGLAVTLAIQHFYFHPRPFVARTDYVLLVDHSADTSFPSEHTTVAFGMAAGIGVYRLRLGAVLIALASATAFSRVFVGIHYPGDVAAGAAIGAVAAAAVWSVRGAFGWLDRNIVIRLVPAPLL